MSIREFVCLRSNELSPIQKEHYAQLFQVVFGFEKPAGLFERQFLPGPEQFAYHGLMMVDGKVKAAYSAIPSTFNSGTDAITAALVVDALVHPDFQGKGLLRQVLNSLYERMQSDGFDFLFGMPNLRFYPILTQSLGWTDLGQMNWFLLFPGSSVPEWRDSNYVYRPMQEGFKAYRFKEKKAKSIDSVQYWFGKTPVPGLSVLLDWEHRNPITAGKDLQKVNSKGVYIFPVWGNSSGGVKLPEFIRGNRTHVAAYPLTGRGKQIIESGDLWLTLADFDVG